MKYRFLLFLLLAGIAWSGVVPAQVSLSKLDRDISGPRTQVLVLGTAHLSNARKGFQAQSLQPVLTRLAAFKPDIIAIEFISGEGCGLMEQYPTIYPPKDIASYCTDTAAARAATGLDIPAAVAAMHAMLATWPQHPTPAQRRHLAAVFLACNEPASALVQWLQLPKGAQHAGDGLDAALVAQLNKRLQSNNEAYQIGSRLAVHLGLQRVYPIDDHTGDNLLLPSDQEKAYDSALTRRWATARSRVAPVIKRQQDLLQHDETLELYRYLNQPAVLQTVIESDMGAALGDGTPPYYGHMYVTGWEGRNLHMAANILATVRERPGARVLVIVGVSHKPWLDEILRQTPSVGVIDVEKVLGSGT